MYRICLIVPERYIHSLCFREIALLLESSLNSNGLSCDFAVNELAEDRINIILGYHLIKHSDEHELLAKYRYIPYQLEQLEAKEGWYSENIRQILKNACEVWDYSKENINFLRSVLDIEAKYLPIGYHEKLEQIEHKSNKDIDILLYGSIGERRKTILTQLMNIPGINVKALFGVYGRERDEFISRSKIILNIHHYSTNILEVVRISYLLNNKCFVLSETSPINPYESVGMCLAPYDKIVETCQYYLNNLSEIERIRIDTYNRFKINYPMIDFMKNILNT